MHWQHRFNHAVQRYNEIYKVQMPNILPHVCRHTYCSNMAKAGMNPKTLQYLMGHSDIGVTIKPKSLGAQIPDGSSPRLQFYTIFSIFGHSQSNGSLNFEKWARIAAHYPHYAAQFRALRSSPDVVPWQIKSIIIIHFRLIYYLYSCKSMYLPNIFHVLSFAFFGGIFIYLHKSAQLERKKE